MLDGGASWGTDEIPDQRVPDGDLFRILGAVEKSGGTYINNVLPGESSWYDLHEITAVKFHNPQRNGRYKWAQGLRMSRHGVQGGQVTTER